MGRDGWAGRVWLTCAGWRSPMVVMGWGGLGQSRCSSKKLQQHEKILQGSQTQGFASLLAPELGSWPGLQKGSQKVTQKHFCSPQHIASSSRLLSSWLLQNIPLNELIIRCSCHLISITKQWLNCSLCLGDKASFSTGLPLLLDGLHGAPRALLEHALFPLALLGVQGINLPA